jgi:hypothetical protein
MILSFSIQVPSYTTCHHNIHLNVILLSSPWLPFCVNYGAPCTVSYNQVAFPRYGKAHHLYNLQRALLDILGDDCNSVYNVLAFLNAVGLAMVVYRTLF